MIFRKCPCCDKKLISLLSVFGKIHASNNYSDCLKCAGSWRVKSNIKAIFRLCFLCYMLLYILVYYFLGDYLIGALSNKTNSIISIIYNVFILALPILLVEILFAIWVPLECKKSD